MNNDTVQYKGKWHTSVDNDIIRNIELSFPARFLWILLKSYASPNSPVPYPGFETLAYFMSSFRKDRCSKKIERKQMDEDTLRKYRKELVDKGFLTIERVRTGLNEFDNNRYVLLDGGPYRENPGTGKSGAGKEPGRIVSGIKDVPVHKDVPKNKRSTRSNSTEPSAPVPVAASDCLPSADFSSKSKAAEFIKVFVYWGKLAGLSPAVIPKERSALEELFKENPNISVRELIGVVLGAWLMESDLDPDTGREKYWHCLYKGKRLWTFLKFLPEIQDELHWKGTEKQIEATYKRADTHFKEI